MARAPQQACIVRVPPARRLALAAAALLGLALTTPLTQAADSVYWSIGISPAPGVVVRASNASPQRVYLAPPTYLAPAPTVYALPQPVYAVPQPVLPPVVYAPPPVAYTSPEVVYTPPAVVYTPPAVVYSPPAVVYSAPPVYQPFTQVFVVRPAPSFVPPGHGYYGHHWHHGHHGRNGHGRHGPGFGPEGRGRH